VTIAGLLSLSPVRLIRQLGLLALCLALLLSLTGCWNRRELDTLGIVLGLGIDKTESSYRESTGIDPVLTSIEVVGDQKEGENPRNVSRISADTFIRTNGLAVFRKDRLIGYLNEEESIGYNYIRDRVRSTVTSIPCESEGRIAFENVHSKTKVKSKLLDGEPVIEVKMNSQVNLGEVLCKYPTSVPANIKKLERSLEKHRIELMESAVKRAREYRVDIFGFGHVFYHEHPGYWKKIQKD
jgi:Spore germination B3/ GerAC like, C-terminal.